MSNFFKNEFWSLEKIKTKFSCKAALLVPSLECSKSGRVQPEPEVLKPNGGYQMMT